MITIVDILLKTETQIAPVLLFVLVNVFLAIRFGVGKLKRHTSDINIVFRLFTLCKTSPLTKCVFQQLKVLKVNISCTKTLNV